MAVTDSGLYVATVVDVYDATQLAIDMSLTSHKFALFNNSITPNFTTDTAFGVAPYNANEVSGTGWAAGGIVFVAPTNSATAGAYVFDQDNVTAAGTTLTGARCGLGYADALAGNNAIYLVDFNADFSTVAGVFTVQFAAGGVWSIDLTP